MVVRLTGFICDRMEAETITDCRPQECFSCFRLSEDNWIPGMQPGDGKRFFQYVQKDILQAKTSGTWSARPGQPGPLRDKKLISPFWDPNSMCASHGCKAHLKECCEALRITQQSFEFNAFQDVPFFDIYQHIGYDSLHGGPLGVWPHLVKASLYTYKQHLLRWLALDGTPIISEKQWQLVLTRIQDRLLQAGSECKATSVSPFLSEVGKRADDDNDNPGRSSHSDPRQCARLSLRHQATHVD